MTQLTDFTREEVLTIFEVVRVALWSDTTRGDIGGQLDVDDNELKRIYDKVDAYMNPNNGYPK